MISVHDLTEYELKYICSQIPHKWVRSYFCKYPREFSKLKPGFRVDSIKNDELSNILYSSISDCFISSFISKIIDTWLKQIEDALDEIKENYDNEDERYVIVLSDSYFSKNVSLYFKILQKEKSEEYLKFLSISVNQCKKFKNSIDDLKRNYEKIISDKDRDIKMKCDFIKRIERDNKNNQKIIEASKKKDIEVKAILDQKDLRINQLEIKLHEFKSKLINLSKQLDILAHEDCKTKKLLESARNEINILNNEIVIYKENLLDKEKIEIQLSDAQIFTSVLEAEIFDLKNSLVHLSECTESNKKYIDELEKIALENSSHYEVKNQTVDISSISSRKLLKTPLRPINMEVFDEYFRTNLRDIGFDLRNDDNKLLVNLVERLVFTGNPLLIKHSPGINLANCLSNSICAMKESKKLIYTPKSDSSTVNNFLANTPDRVVCLDGFIGNCNALELLPILKQYRNKIIILTYLCDRTLNYIPQELLSYMWYINVDNIYSLMRIKDLSEDSFSIQEESYSVNNSCDGESRYKRIFKEISEQCELSSDVSNFLLDVINDENALISVLLFSLLPYVKKVSKMNPYNCSPRLQKYAGESGKCPNKSTMLTWFG